MGMSVKLGKHIYVDKALHIRGVAGQPNLGAGLEACFKVQ